MRACYRRLPCAFALSHGRCLRILLAFFPSFYISLCFFFVLFNSFERRPNRVKEPPTSAEPQLNTDGYFRVCFLIGTMYDDKKYNHVQVGSIIAFFVNFIPSLRWIFNLVLSRLESCRLGSTERLQRPQEQQS